MPRGVRKNPAKTIDVQIEELREKIASQKVSLKANQEKLKALEARKEKREFALLADALKESGVTPDRYPELIQKLAKES